MGLVLAVALAAVKAQAATTRPNIVVNLADDFGWGSLGCYGAPEMLNTPNLDRLAREGWLFTHVHVAVSVCSQTRYGLLTGRYYWRTSVKDGEVLPANAPLHIEPTRITLASLCKGQGYRTAAFGKWHLGMGSARIDDWSGVLRPGPLVIGFDDFFGTGSNPWLGLHAFIENDRVLGRLPGMPVTLGARFKRFNDSRGGQGKHHWPNGQHDQQRSEAEGHGLGWDCVFSEAVPRRG